ncbi:MAG: hypothetical protein CFE32_20815, partial [Alphaproteobacteria bacterium PA3]
MSDLQDGASAFSKRANNKGPRGKGMKLGRLAALVVGALAFPATAYAQPEIVSDSGDTAWILTASAFVLMMTIPGLGLFYGGLVRAKNVLSVIMHSFV